jgi:hypothetical protein
MRALGVESEETMRATGHMQAMGCCHRGEGPVTVINNKDTSDMVRHHNRPADPLCIQ